METLAILVGLLVIFAMGVVVGHGSGVKQRSEARRPLLDMIRTYGEVVYEKEDRQIIQVGEAFISFARKDDEWEIEGVYR